MRLNNPTTRPFARTAFLALVLACSLTLGSAALAGSPKETVQAVNDAWNAAFNRQDADSLADLYTSDAIVIPPQSGALRGEDTIRTFWADLMAKGFTDHAIEILEVRRRGKVIYEVARWQARGPDGNGGMKTYEGQLVNVLRQQEDGSWRSELHIWN